MRTSSVWLLLLAVGCGNAVSPAQLKTRYDGTLALSTDGKLLYAANVDVGTVTVVDSQARSVVATVTVGSRPSRIAVGADDTLYVSNRGSRSVSVIHRGVWSAAATIPTEAEPIGLAISADGRTLYVACTVAGTLDAFDLSQPGFARQWQASLGDLPRGVAVLPNGQLYVSHYKTATVDIVDATSGNLLGSTSTAVGVDPLSAGSTVGPLAPSIAFRPVGLDSILVSPDGTQAYLVHRRDRLGIIGSTPSDGGSTPVVVPAITTLDVATGTARDDAFDPDKDFPVPVIFPASAAVAELEEVVPGTNNGAGSDSSAGVATPAPAQSACIRDGGAGGGSSIASLGYSAAPPTPAPVNGGGVAALAPPPAGVGWTQGPVAAVEDTQGQHLYVANQSSNNVSVLNPVDRRAAGADNGVVGVALVGIAPSGLALSADGSTLYVYESDWEEIGHVLVLEQQIRFVSTATLSNSGDLPTLVVSNDSTLDPVFIAGRQLFLSSADADMTVPGAGVACESCHLEGGNDGNVWQFPFGPRKTPSLLGRKTQDTAPYHWDGTEGDFTAFFFETVQMRMGGQGVNSTEAEELETFMQGLQTPDNPFVQPGGLTTAQAAGKALFAGKAGCIACHSGPDFTDNSFHDVGTFVSVNPEGNPDDACRLDPSAGPCVGLVQDCAPAGANPANTVHGFNTPSLLGVVWAAPYLHTGSAATLVDRILENPGDVHGSTSTLSADEVDDLVQYLQTL